MGHPSSSRLLLRNFFRFRLTVVVRLRSTIVLNVFTTTTTLSRPNQTIPSSSSLLLSSSLFVSRSFYPFIHSSIRSSIRPFVLPKHRGSFSATTRRCVPGFRGGHSSSGPVCSFAPPSKHSSDASMDRQENPQGKFLVPPLFFRRGGRFMVNLRKTVIGHLAQHNPSE